MEKIKRYDPDFLEFHGRSYAVVNLRQVCGERMQEMPWVMRLLMENVIRHMRGDERDQAVSAMLDWLQTGKSEHEIAFQPGRVLMHDTTSTPALVDVAAMRDALSEAGMDPALLNPVLPVDVSVDHSLAVEAYAKPGADVENLKHEIRRNAERYRFLRWASRALKGVRIHPPGTGIMHTINLEQLATVVTTEELDGLCWMVPDMMIGTDSHTPMINGIGVLGWGVGGLEAQTVMFGLPTMLRIPEVIGVRLTGRLSAGVWATDLALVVTQRLRDLGVAGEFVEFFGPGVSELTAGDRAVVANMAPEYGATTGYFAVDRQTLNYLQSTGRSAVERDRLEAYMNHMGLWFDPHAQPRYSKTVDIDLGQIGMHVAGPRRPQDLWSYHQTGVALAKTGFNPTLKASPWPAHPVAIAAITSCTNTSDPALLMAAGMLARKARTFGLKVPHWVKTSLAPGSPAALSYLRRAGLLEDLESIGFGIVGFGCTTCIGNPGPLTESIVQAQSCGASKAVAILSGNRNFPGRVHPDIELSFIMSPPMVIAFGLAGDASLDMASQPLQITPEGRPVYLKDIWPTSQEVADHLAMGLNSDDFSRDFKSASANPLWEGLNAPATPTFPWDDRSTILRRPPFASVDAGSQLGHFVAHPLLVVGDDVTTDHISPASAIPPDSLVADFLVSKGEDRHDLNVFASRRGNWEVMMRAAFHHKTLVNLLGPGIPLAHTVHAPSGEIQPIWDVAARYHASGEPVVLVAGERYGMGSSRDWAAKGQRLLHIRAVLAVSFERIHRSNLIGMGILPIWLPEGVNPTSLALQSRDLLEVDARPDQLAPRSEVEVTLRRQDGSVLRFMAKAAVETRLEVELLRVGGVIPSILQGVLHSRPVARATA